FIYDAWNRLVTVKSSGGSTLETLRYDALGRRISGATTSTTDFYYSKDWQGLEGGGGGTEFTHGWSPGYAGARGLADFGPVGQIVYQRLWVQQDANWNVTALVDVYGNVIERYAYDPFGTQTVYDGNWNVRTSSAYSWTYGYQGLQYDPVLGGNYNYGR